VKNKIKFTCIGFVLSLLILLFISGCGGGSGGSGISPDPVVPTATTAPTVPPSEVSISGQVLDSGNHPISGALVALYAYNSVVHLNTSASPTQTTKTNISGEYTFNNVAAGECRIEAWMSEEDYFANPSSPMGAINFNTSNITSAIIIREDVVEPTPTPGPTATPKPSVKTPVPTAVATQAPPPTPIGGVYDWTYMVYMGADNNLADYGLEDINEMEIAGSTSQVAIITQAEFDPAYAGSSQITTRDALRIHVLKDSDKNNPDLSGAINIGEVDMTSAAALSDFINWTKTTYPANHYVLVFWDHGAGWREGVSFKGAITDHTGSIMELPDLAKGVRDSGVHFDLICFDACLMAMYEVACEFKGLTDYMAFSEDNEPGPGYPYNTILPVLTGNPSITARDFAISTVNNYQAYYPSNWLTTHSAVDMSYVEQLNTNIRALANELTNDPNTFATVEGAKSSSYSYGYGYYYDINQICAYLETNLTSTDARDAAIAVKNLIPSVVIANKTTGIYPSVASKGLSIYISGGTPLSSYGPLACNDPFVSSWYEFLTALNK